MKAPVSVTQVETPAPDSAELAPLLEKCAEYSERLIEAVLRYSCTEKVAEKIGTSAKSSRTKKWTYDYQTVLQGGQLIEKRMDGEKGEKNQDSEGIPLDTLYKSRNPFFLPVIFLDWDRQLDYVYTLIGRETQQNRSIVHISAVPLEAGSDLPAGQLWIDETNGSVLQIVFDPKTLSGFNNRYRMAERNRKLITITDTHQYHMRHQDLQFPTSTYITETQELKKIPANMGVRPDTQAPMPETTYYSVHFQYEDFRFSDVSSEESISDWVTE